MVKIHVESCGKSTYLRIFRIVEGSNTSLERTNEIFVISLLQPCFIIGLFLFFSLYIRFGSHISCFDTFRKRSTLFSLVNAREGNDFPKWNGDSSRSFDKSCHGKYGYLSFITNISHYLIIDYIFFFYRGCIIRIIKLLWRRRRFLKDSMRLRVIIWLNILLW